MTLLEAKDLTKQFNGHEVVKQLTFSVREGSCVALLGPNGAGKTTTIHMLAGLLRPTQGNISLYQSGKIVTDRRPYIGYLPQMPSFYPWMSGMEFVQYTGELAGLTSSKAKIQSQELLEVVGLRDAAKRRIGGYSGGMKQRLGFAQALIHRPKLLILDEPVSALDPAGRRDVLQLLQQIREETTILFSTHVLHDAEEICDDIIVIREGRIALQGSLEQIRASYREPVISIEVAGDERSKSWLSKISAKPYVQEFEYGRDSIRLTVNDVEQSQQDLLADALQHHILLRKFEAGHSTLEDLFLKVVQQ